MVAAICFLAVMFSDDAIARYGDERKIAFQLWTGYTLYHTNALLKLEPLKSTTGNIQCTRSGTGFQLYSPFNKHLQPDAFVTGNIMLRGLFAICLFVES